jgi:tetratricopeptide (TPR) repeat protein
MSGSSPSAAAERRTPLPLPLGACVLLLLLLAVGQAAEAHARGAVPAVLLPGALAMLDVGLAFALYARRGWARPAAALLFAAASSLSLLRDGAAPASILVPLLAAGYLLVPSTERLFREGGVSTLDRRTLLAGGLVLVLASALGLLLELGAPTWATHLAAVAGGALWMGLLELGAGRRLVRLLGRGPQDLGREHRRRFRDALAAHSHGRHPVAARLLRDLPQTRSVETLRALLRAEAPPAGIDRLVYDAGAELSDHESRELGQRLALSEADSLLERRARLLDGLVEDSLGAEPVFGGDLPRVVSRMSGAVFVANAEQQARDWWRGARPSQTGPVGRAWLAVRLTEAGCPRGAARLARLADAPGLAEAAELLSLLREWPEQDVDAWLSENALPLLVVAPLAETTGSGALVIARRLKQRPELIATLRQVWDRYGDLMPLAETRALLAHVTGCRPRSVGTRGRFERWWRRHAEPERRFDEAFARGMEWAGLEEWEAAAAAFAEARLLRPRRPSAGYNRALCLVRLDRAEEAEAALADLTRLEPREALWWMRLGDVRRLGRRTETALDAYRAARRLSGNTDQSLALRFGVSMWRSGNDGEARRAVSEAFGVDAEEIEADHWEELLAAEDHRWTTRSPGRLPPSPELEEWVDWEPEGGDEGPPTLH